MEFKPGQYFILMIDGQARQYSVSSSAEKQNEFQMTVGFFKGGLASEYLDGLNEGDVAEFKGPAGIFMLQETDRDKVFLVTGTGVAPVKSMIETYLDRGGDAKLYLLFGEKNRDSMYYYDHFKALSDEHSNFDFDICLSREEELNGLDEKHVALGHVNDVYDVFLEEEKPDVNAFEYYLCGSRDVVESLKEYVSGLGVKKENMFFENFG